MKPASLSNDLPLIRDWDGGGLPPCGSFAGLDATDRAAREEILHRAYAIWESEGYPQDRKLANWLQAETEILG